MDAHYQRRHCHDFHLDFRPLRSRDLSRAGASQNEDEARRPEAARSLETGKARPAARLLETEPDSPDGRANPQIAISSYQPKLKLPSLSAQT